MKTKTEDLDLAIINLKNKPTFIRPDWANDGAIIWSVAHDASIKISGSLGDMLFFEKAPKSLPLQASIDNGGIKPPAEAPPGSMSDLELWEQIRAIEDPKFKAIASQLMHDEALSYVEIQPPVLPRFEPLPDSMHPFVRQAMPFPSMYSHQVQSLLALREGRDLAFV